MGVAAGSVAAVPLRVARTLDVGSAYDELASAEAANEDAQVAVSEARTELHLVEADLDKVSSERRVSFTEYERLVTEARQLMTDAYIRGASADELTMLFDPEAATDDAVRAQLTSGRVNRSREVAASLRSVRAEFDDDINDLIDRVSAARQALADAESERAQAETRVEEARAAVGEAETVAANERLAAEAASRNASASRSEPAADTQSGGSDPEEAPPSSRGGGGGTPTATTQYGGPTVNLDQAWAYLRDCESGGNYKAVDPSGTYLGAYQFDQQTWESVGGSGSPVDASPAEQDYRAWLLYQQRGNSPWPYCGRFLP